MTTEPSHKRRLIARDKNSSVCQRCGYWTITDSSDIRYCKAADACSRLSYGKNVSGAIDPPTDSWCKSCGRYLITDETDPDYCGGVCRRNQLEIDSDDDILK